VLLAAIGATSPSRAQDALDPALFGEPLQSEPPLPGDPGDIPWVEPSAEDVEVDRTVGDILARREFEEFSDQRGEGLRDLVERLVEWLFRPDEDASGFEAPQLGAFALPGATFFLVAGGLLLLAVGVYVYVTRRRDRDALRKTEEAPSSGDPRDRAPASFLDEAARLAEAGDLREALRALYLATLVALDRRRLIAFDPHLTNWQYLRQMPRGDAREAFTHFTRLFDFKWYGREVTSREDYERCRALASEIVGASSIEAAA
jgi:hypothetical protein